MVALFNLILFNPLYNALVFITDIIPGNNIGVAIIILTIIVKIILFPLYHKSVKTQSKIKEIEPELKSLKNKYNDDKQEQAKQIMELYRHHGINPFVSIVLLFIQLPIFIALFYVFFRGFELNLDILYSFIPPPAVINTELFGLLDIAEKSFILALLVGGAQFIQMKFSLPPLPPIDRNKKERSIKDDFARSFNIQMRYIMPIIIVFIASSLPAAVGLYWLTSNLFAIGHELLVKRKALNILTGRSIT
ncbi:MAG: YidC/Oxa1 family membrane protein insertase [Candidatus Paceibacterota bacterium]